MKNKNDRWIKSRMYVWDKVYKIDNYSSWITTYSVSKAQLCELTCNVEVGFSNKSVWAAIWDIAYAGVNG